MTKKEIQKMCARHNRELWRTILAIIVLLIGLAGVLYAGIMQMILCYEKFGVIINSEHLIIPHLSLLGYLGIIPLSFGWFIFD